MDADILLTGVMPGALLLIGFILGRATARRRERQTSDVQGGDGQSLSDRQAAFDAARFLRKAPPETVAMLEAEISSHGAIAAIRLLRGQSGLELREAKAVIDTLLSRRAA